MSGSQQAMVISVKKAPRLSRLEFTVRFRV